MNTEEKTVNKNTLKSSPKIELVAPVCEVILYEDRGDIVRKFCVFLEKGANEFVLKNTSPLVSSARTSARIFEAASLKATDEPRSEASAYVSELDVLFRWRREGAALREQAEFDFQQRINVQRREISDAKDALHLIQLKLKRTLLRRNAGTRRFGIYAFSNKSAGALRSFFRKSEHDIERLLQEQSAALEKVKSLEGELGEQLLLLKKEVPNLHLVSDTLISLYAEEAGEVDVELLQQLPCALWRPSHQMHVNPPESSEPIYADAQNRKIVGKANVRWTVAATLWQQTFEDWHNVLVRCSTQRPSAGTNLPRLYEDVLQARVKKPEERKEILIEHRQEKRSKSIVRSEVPGVFDGGEVRELTVPHRVSLRSDGRPLRVEITSFESNAEIDKVAFPDESMDVFLRAQLKNTQEIPFLAGPVRLLLQGAEVGFTDVPFVGSGANFSIGLTQDEQLQVRCFRERKIEERRMLKDRVHFITRLEFRSASDCEETFQVELRFPKSEVAKLKVIPSMNYCSLGEPKLDDDGIWRFNIRVPARGIRVESCGFYFELGSGVSVPDPW